MIGEHQARPGRPRLVVDPGVYVSAAISGTGAPAHLLETAIEGRVDLDDDYLVALAEATGATLLVSGDQDLLSVRRPGLDVRSPRDAIDAILYAHPWGPALIPAEAEAAWRQAAATGHSNVLETTAVFLTIMRESYAIDLLAHVVTPESLSGWIANLEKVRDLVSERGMASGVDYPGNDIAHVKLPPDPGETVRATGDVLLEGSVIVTLQRRPELADALGLGGWRVHGIGDYLRPEDLPSRVP